MRRVPHYIRANASGAAPTRILCVDIETELEWVSDTEAIHRLVFGWTAFVRRRGAGQWSSPQWTRFSSAAEWYEVVRSHLAPKSRLLILAHNSAFEATVLDVIGMVERLGGRLTKAILRAPPWCVDIQTPAGNLRWSDTLNYYQASINELGSRLGLPKLERPDTWTGSQSDDQYCRRDVEICLATYQQWSDWIITHDFGSQALTRSGQAWNAYRHRFMRHKLLVDTHVQATPLARASYAGGRTECYHIGRVEGPIYRLDINSQYPSVMRHNLYPIRLRGYRKNISLHSLSNLLDIFCVVADVTLCTTTNVYPLKSAVALVFPTGTYRTTLNTPELRYAMRHGHVVSVHQVAWYDGADIFSEFIDTLYPLRLAARHAGNSMDDYNLKLIMNGLYGKFGQSGYILNEIEHTTEYVIGSMPCYNTVANKWEYITCLGYTRQEMQREGESSDSIPAIAAHVTSYARQLLWRYMTIAGVENVVYCDTDSVWCREVGYQRLRESIAADALGLLKLEGVEPWVTLHGPKDYEYPNVTKIKGIRKEAVYIGHNTWLQDQWERPRGMLLQGRLSEPRIRLAQKVLERRYTKGHVAASGTVRPYVLPDDAQHLV